MSAEQLVPAMKDYELVGFKAKMRSVDAKADHPLKKKRGRQDENALVMEERAKPNEFGKNLAPRKNDALSEYLEKEKTEYDPLTWEERRVQISQNFKTEFGGMEVFLNEGGDRDLDRPIRLGKGRSRLDQLTQKKGARGQKIASITAEEFESQFEKLAENMNQFWEKDNKVSCLKICIQCAKLLNDVETPTFYPQKFMIMTEILDMFGKIVFLRMKKMSLETQGYENWETVLDNNINFKNTPDFVTEKASNWQLKIACIREVLPRMYLELALVNTKRFMNKRLNVSDLDRLGFMIRGIAEPLSSSYIGAYLARVGSEIDPEAKEYLFNILQCLYKHWEYAIEYGHPNVEPKKYFKLFEPAIDWIFYCAGKNSTEKHFKRTIKMYNENQK